MRLAVVSHPCFRAVNRRVHAELEKRGIEVLIIAPARLGSALPDPRAPGDPPVTFLALTSDNPRSYQFAGAEAELARFRPHAILVEADPVSRLTVSLGRWARANQARLFCLSVDNLDFGFLPHLRRTGLKSLPKILAKNMLHHAARPLVDGVFTISREGTNVFRKRGYRSVRQVPLGFDPNLFHVDPEARSVQRRDLKIPEGAVTFAYFGRVVPQKGVHLIVEALARLAKAHPKAEWRFLLDKFEGGDYASRIEHQIVQAGLAPKVLRFEASHEEICNFMRAADVLLLASLSSATNVEQYGRVIPEAMACGALAIVSDSGTPKELVGECGLVLPEGNVDRLEAALADVLADPAKYTPMREAGTARAMAQLSLSRQAGIYFDVLQDTIR